MVIHVLGFARMKLHNDVFRLPKKIFHDAHDRPVGGEHRAIHQANADVLPSIAIAGDHLDFNVSVERKPEATIEAIRIIRSHCAMTHACRVYFFPVGHNQTIRISLAPLEQNSCPSLMKDSPNHFNQARGSLQWTGQCHFHILPG